MAGFAAGLLTMVAVLGFTRIDFTWHTLIGCVSTIAVGVLTSAIRRTIRSLTQT
jgi:hypothetical protein